MKRWKEYSDFFFLFVEDYIEGEEENPDVELFEVLEDQVDDISIEETKEKKKLVLSKKKWKSFW